MNYSHELPKKNSLKMSKTLISIITILSVLMLSFSSVNADNTISGSTENSIREQINKKLVIPEQLNGEEIISGSVTVLFSVDRKNRLDVKKVSGENYLLNEYVMQTLQLSKVNVASISTDQIFQLTIRFKKQ